MAQQAMKLVWAAVLVGFVATSWASHTPALSSQAESTPTAASHAEFVELVFEPCGATLDAARVGELLDVARRRCSAAGATATPVLSWVEGQLIVRFPAPRALGELELWKARLGRQRRLTFEIVADPLTPHADLGEELARLRKWRASNLQASLDEFNALAREQGGPAANIRWRGTVGAIPQAHASDLSAVACERVEVVAPGLPWVFDEGDIAALQSTKSQSGADDIGVELRAERRAAFEAFTKSALDRHLALAFDGIVFGAPVVKAPLQGAFPLSLGAFARDRDTLLRELRGGRLPCELALVAVRPPAPR